MKLIHQNSIYLESFSFKEELSGTPELEVSDVKLDNLNLFIGNNAQGKSRLFRTIKFIKELLTDDRRKISTNFTATFIFSMNDENEHVKYELHVLPSNEGNNYIETINKGKLVLLSTVAKKLFNEETNKYIDNFFIPQNIPAISARNEPQFITDYLEDYVDSIQIIMSSHSPLMSKFIHPKNWQIVKRKGYKIRISKPSI